MESVDTLVVGAGVIGLACADALGRAGRGTVVVESAALYGSGRYGARPILAAETIECQHLAIG